MERVITERSIKTVNKKLNRLKGRKRLFQAEGTE